MLSDREQRALEELERLYVFEAHKPVRPGRAHKRSSRRSSRPPGLWTVLVLACVCVGLVFASVPAAGFSLALATALGWFYWRLWAHRPDDGSMPAPPWTGGGPAKEGSSPQPGGSIRRYVTWLAAP
jgi:hypothetical protein